MTNRQPSHEVLFKAKPAWTMLLGLPAYVAGVVALGAFLSTLSRDGGAPNALFALFVVFAILSGITVFLMLFGFFVVPPNIARVLVLFGRYRGTVREPGFYWTNPFTLRHKVSQRAHNVASQKIKVNDLLGNPIEIGAVVVWQVRDTAQAVFDVENFVNFVDVQIETAVRSLASTHPYDEGQAEGHSVTLRGDAEQIAVELRTELQHRLDRAGIEIIEARISHLAYAQEIASAMLQRQQATAVIAARAKIVEGAVGMVEHALEELGRKKILTLDDERRATLVGNLLVVLCSHSAPQPVLNTGSLYT
ncbi:MAG: SPFH domain-containing protein [Planctomycetota bacterium]